jgi:hypothetical protein
VVCLSVCPNKQQGGHSGKKLEVLDLSYTQITKTPGAPPSSLRSTAARCLRSSASLELEDTAASDRDAARTQEAVRAAIARSRHRVLRG